MPQRSSRKPWLLVSLVTLWFLCVALHLDRQLSPAPLAWVPLYVDPTPGGFPIVRGYWPETPRNEHAFEPGDRLLAAGSSSLRGVSRFGFWASVLEAEGAGLIVPVRFERRGEVHQAGLTLRAVDFPWRTLPLSLALGVLALLVFARARGMAEARAFAFGAIAYSIQWSFFFGGAPWRTHLGLAAFLLAGAFYQPLTLRAALLFPQDVAIRSRLAHGLCWIFSATAFGLWLWLFGSPLSGAIGLRILALSYGLWIAMFLAIVLRNYRRSRGRGRRQLRWVLYGFTVGLAPALGGAAVLGARPDLRWVYELSLVPTAVIPACIFIALARYRLYDIDRLITTTIAYVALAPLLLGVLFTAGVPFSEWARDALGIHRITALWILAFAVAAPLPLLARRLRPQVERLFFRDRFRFESGIRALRDDVMRLAKADEAWPRLGEGLDALISLNHVVIFARAGDVFLAVYARGTVAPDGFDAESGLCALVADARSVVGTERIAQWVRAGAVTPIDRVSLEALEPSAILPLYRGDVLDAFVCLGEKRSGDVFTRSELALLESLGERFSLVLGRFDEKQRFSSALEAVESSQRERMEWLEHFARFLRHELKNQLIGMESSLDLARRAGDTEQRARLISRSAKSAGVMMRILRAASEATSLEGALSEEDLQPVDLSGIAEASVRDCLAARSDRDVDFVGENGLQVRGDEARLLQMFEKILQNACDHCTAGEKVRVLADRVNGWARVRIINPGEALPADIDSLFQPFRSQRSAKLRGEGNLGIGLYVARQIVQAHGGELSARSLSAPAGAEFEVRLPLIQPS